MGNLICALLNVPSPMSFGDAIGVVSILIGVIVSIILYWKASKNSKNSEKLRKDFEEKSVNFSRQIAYLQKLSLAMHEQLSFGAVRDRLKIHHHKIIAPIPSEIPQNKDIPHIVKYCVAENNYLNVLSAERGEFFEIIFRTIDDNLNFSGNADSLIVCSDKGVKYKIMRHEYGFYSATIEIPSDYRYDFLNLTFKLADSSMQQGQYHCHKLSICIRNPLRQEDGDPGNVTKV